MATETFRIIIEQRGANRATGEVRRLGRESQRTQRAIGLLRNAFLAFGAAAGVRELIQVADSFNAMENRIRLVVGSTKEVNKTFGQLFDVAQATRAPLDATTELFRRMAVNSQGLDLTQTEMLATIKSINQAIAISGATAQEARNGIIQLSQGFASGQLRGEEFRAVAEQLPRLLIAIADGTGRTIGSLRALAFEGKLTPQIVADAIASQAEVIDLEFRRITPTIEQAGVVLGNAFTKFLGDLNKAAGTSQTFQKVLFTLADNVSQLVTGVLSAATAYATYRVAAKLATLATGGLTLSLVGLRTALVRTGIGALVVALGFAIDALLQFGLATEEVEGVAVNGFDRIAVGFRAAMATIRQLVAPLFAFITAGFQTVRSRVSEIAVGLGLDFSGVPGVISGAFRLAFELMKAPINLMIALVKSQAELIALAFDRLPEAIGNSAKAAANAFGDILTRGVNRVIVQLNRALETVGSDIRFGTLSFEGFEEGPRTLTDLFSDSGKILGANFQRDFVQEGLNGLANFGKSAVGTFGQNFEAEYAKLIAELKEAAAEEQRQQDAMDAAKAAAEVQPGDENEKTKEQLAAGRQLLSLENQLRVAAFRRLEPIDAELEKLTQKKAKVEGLLAKSGNEVEAARALALIEAERNKFIDKRRGLSESVVDLQEQIREKIKAIAEFSPIFAAEMERALAAILEQGGGLQKTKAELEGLNTELTKTGEKREKELRKQSEQFAEGFATDLAGVLSGALRGEAVDFAQFFADQAAKFFEESLQDVFKSLSKSFTDLLSKAGGVGGGEEGGGGFNLGGALGALVGVGGLLLSAALRDTETTVQNELANESIVDDVTPVRGVVAGDTSIPIFQLGEELQEVNEPLVELLTEIRDLLAGQGGDGASALDFDDQAGALLSNSPSLI